MFDSTAWFHVSFKECTALTVSIKEIELFRGDLDRMINQVESDYPVCRVTFRQINTMKEKDQHYCRFLYRCSIKTVTTLADYLFDQCRHLLVGLL
jgi:hypothetical protein